jgi:hypothetical protein
MRKVKVVNVVAGSYYSDEYTSGGLVNVTLQRGKEQVTCNDILIFDADDAATNDTFEEWKQLAQDGEEGYDYSII